MKTPLFCSDSLFDGLENMEILLLLLKELFYDNTSKKKGLGKKCMFKEPKKSNISQAAEVQNLP